MPKSKQQAMRSPEEDRLLASMTRGQRDYYLLKKNPARLAESRRKARERARQLRQDAETKAKLNAEQRLFYQKRMADPIKRDAIRAKARVRYRLKNPPRPKLVKQVAGSLKKHVQAVRPVMTNTLFQSVWKLVPASDAREDIVSEALIALLSGEASKPAEAVKMGRTSHFRQFSKFGAISMDAVMPSGLTLHDVLSVESLAC